jgi:cardiolipin synthase
MIGLGALLFRVLYGPLRGKPTVLSKLNTGMQLAVVLGVVLNAATGFPPREMLDVLVLATFVSTLISGADYMVAFARRAVAA